jgi:glucose/arabinose dehydrogenase
LPEKLYYVNANEDKIYRSSETGTGWTREEVVYDHDTYVRDLAFDLDQDGDLVLYFSEATGAGADGKIYRIEDDAPVLYRTIALSDVGGSWAGDFAFGEDGTLYLSSGNRVPASIYKVDEGGGPGDIRRQQRAHKRAGLQRRLPLLRQLEHEDIPPGPEDLRARGGLLESGTKMALRRGVQRRYV